MEDREQIFKKGISFLNQGNPEQAIAHLEHFIKSDNQAVDALYNLGIALFHQGRFTESIHFLSVLRTLIPGNIKLLNNLGSAYRNNIQPEKALECFEGALKIAPDDPDILSNLGILLQEMGEYGRAKACLEKSLARQKDHVGALRSLSEIKRFEKNDPLFEQMGALVDDPALSLQNKMTLRFALGKMYADIEDFDASFANYQTANELRDKVKAPRPFSIREHRQFVDMMVESITPEYLGALAEHGSSSRTPIFIIGMPRSGTTLVEQILSSHSMVFGAGELNAITQLKARLSQPHEQALPHEAMDPSLVGVFSKEYLALIKQLSNDAPFVVDKFPQNFLHLWLIALMFPKARIIHIKRDPVDTCLSCYFQNFTFGHEYKHRLDCLGAYYNEYEKLMAHWEQVITVPMLSIQYEDIIADQEAAVSQLLGFCGLEFEQKCMEFYKLKRNIPTGSWSQVRRPIYNSSVGRWKSYEKHLEPLLNALKGNPE